MFKSEEMTKFFPQTSNGLTYLDSAATSLKYGPMLDKIYEFEKFAVSNVHRGAHRLSVQATDLYEDSRKVTADYLNAKTEEIIFTAGTTDALNLLALHFDQVLEEGDVVVVSEMEHHANLLPWQEMVRRKKLELKLISVNEDGDLNLDDLDNFIKEGRVKLVSLCHVSNTLGTVNPVLEISKKCRENNIYFGLDGAQSVTLMNIDVEELGVDFFCFSAHKVFGPFGLGILYLSKELQDKFSPVRRGGGIITDVEFKDHGLLDGPIKFEPGTPNITAIAFFSEAIKFLSSLDFGKVFKHDQSLLEKARFDLSKLGGFMEFGISSTKANILSFNYEGVHPNDLCELIDQQGVALRSGHHCTQPLFKKFNLSGSARASFSVYNLEEDVDKLVESTKKALELLR